MRSPTSRRRLARRTVLETRGGDLARDALEPAAPAIGHNRPPIETPRLPAGAACARCQHWRAPSAREVDDYEAFQRGVSKRRVKEPAGACFRVLHHPNGRPAFAASVGRSACFNFEPDTRPRPA